MLIMRNNNRIVLLLSLIISICYGCKKTFPDNNPIINPITNNTTPGQVTITGTVTKSDGTAADNTTISIGATTVTTATDGTYSFTGVVADSNKVIIKFSKPGFIDTWRTLAVESGAIYNDINISFYTPVNTSFSATTGGAATVPNIGLTMTFTANSFAKEDGTTYTGTVTVESLGNAGIYLEQLLPGDVRAIDANNNPVVLEAYSGWYFRLKGQAGEVLKLSKSMTYSCSAPTINAPTSPKLWYFNEMTGLWAESAGAVMANNTYVGSTTNVGFLQLALPYTSTLLRLTIKDAKGVIPAGFQVLNSHATNIPSYYYGATLHATVNSKGVCLLYVPSSTTLSLTLNSDCVDHTYLGTTQQLAPGVKTEQLITPILTPYITSVTGKVEDCTFQPLSGRAELKLKDITYTTTLVNGSYTFNVITCSTGPLGILAVYDANNKILVQNPGIVLTAGYATQVTPTSSCTTPITGTFTYTVAGQTYTLTTPQDKITYEIETDPLSGGFVTMLRGNGVGKGFYLSSESTAAGTYPVLTADFAGAPGYDYVLTWGFYTPGNVIYTKYKSGTTIVEGTFKTNTTLNYCLACPNKMVEVSGSFKLDQ